MKRVITGVLLAAFIFLILFYKQLAVGWFFMMIAGGIGLHEYFTMTLAPAEQKHRKAGIVLGLFVIFASYSGRIDLVAAALILSFLALFVLVLFFYGDLTTQKPSINVLNFLVRFAFGVLYIGFFGAHVILIFSTTSGPYWLILLFLIISVSDSSAYYSGRAFGRHKLCPAISPGKTIEGFTGGLLGATAAAIAASFFLFPQIHFVIVGIIAIITICFGVVGDLLESVIKRSVNVKDSGTILPGHGGILDRMDSLLVSAPPFFYMIHYLFPICK